MAEVVALRSCTNLAWPKTKFTQNFDLLENRYPNSGATRSSVRYAAGAGSGIAQATPVPFRPQYP